MDGAVPEDGLKVCMSMRSQVHGFRDLDRISHHKMAHRRSRRMGFPYRCKLESRGRKMHKTPRTSADRVPVLLYHRVAWPENDCEARLCVDPDTFEAQFATIRRRSLKKWRSNYVSGISEALRWPLGPTHALVPRADGVSLYRRSLSGILTGQDRKRNP